MVYQVKLETFQGPLDLLYELVKKNKIEINKISLAEITEQYLEYTGYFNQFNLDMATEFTVIASELIQLKVNSLLPEDEKKEEDSKTGLVQRLKKYHLFKKVSELLGEKEKKAHNIFFRPSGVSNLDIDDYELDLDINISRLKEAYLNAYKSESEPEEKSTEDELNYLKEEDIKLEDKIEEIEKILKDNIHNIYFYHLVNDKNNVLEVVVTLLGILELIKLKKIKIKQESQFDDIKIIME